MKNLREMDKLYQENSRHKAETEQLKEQNKQLEQGLKEVIENLKKYTPGEVSLKGQVQGKVSWDLLLFKGQRSEINVKNLITVWNFFLLWRHHTL